MRRVCVSPKIVLVKVLFSRSPTTVDLQSAGVWDGSDALAAPVETRNASANRQITLHNLVDMRHYLNFHRLNGDTRGIQGRQSSVAKKEDCS